MEQKKENEKALLEKEIRQERRNMNDEVYINLMRFLGAMTVLTGVGVLINNNMRFSVSTYVLFAMGFAIAIGAELWARDNKKNIERILHLEDEMEKEDTGSSE